MMSKLIFFVDDDSMMLNLLEYTLNTREDLQVKTFLSGDECLENIHLNPSMIVLDHFFKMNGVGTMNGLEILKKIRSRNVSIPVIILTGQEDCEIYAKYKQYGVTAYIPKNDFFIDKLSELINSTI